MTTDEPLDPRSTGRKRGRAVLKEIGRPEWCGSTQEGGVKVEVYNNVKVGCGRSPVREDAPGGYYPSMETLQVNHINKNVLDNDPVNLEWLCASCHKVKDSQTEKGESAKGDEYGYGLIPIVEDPDCPPGMIYMMPADYVEENILGMPGVRVVEEE